MQFYPRSTTKQFIKFYLYDMLYTYWEAYNIILQRFELYRSDKKKDESYLSYLPLYILLRVVGSWAILWLFEYNKSLLALRWPFSSCGFFRNQKAANYYLFFHYVVVIGSQSESFSSCFFSPELLRTVTMGIWSPSWPPQ